MHAAAEIAYHLRIVQGLAERVSNQLPVWENPMEARYAEILEEKIITIKRTLEELKTDPSMNENIHKYLSIIYRDDETEMRLFEQWKRGLEQNQMLSQDILDELEDTMKRMKKELEKAVPSIEELAGGWEAMRIIVPALYRETATEGEVPWTEER